MPLGACFDRLAESGDCLPTVAASEIRGLEDPLSRKRESSAQRTGRFFKPGRKTRARRVHGRTVSTGGMS